MSIRQGLYNSNRFKRLMKIQQISKKATKNSILSTFKERVLEVVRKIPKGKTMTYREVAAAAGSPGAFRAVGTVMSQNFDPTVPCHRVVKSDGTLGGYNRRLGMEKAEILGKEGVIVTLKNSK